MISKKLKKHDKGKTKRYICKTYRPEKVRQIVEIIKSSNEKEPLIARGRGTSYGDSALSASGTIKMQRLDKFVELNESEVILKVEAGITLADIQNIVSKKGWSLPSMICPKDSTIGGYVAKNYKFCELNAEDIVQDLTILNSKAEYVTCSATDNSELFYSTIGGHGLTGVIVYVSIKLVSSITNSLEIKRTLNTNFLESVELLDKSKSQNLGHIVAKIDHNKTASYFEEITSRNNNDQNVEGKLVSLHKSCFQKKLMAIFGKEITNIFDEKSAIDKELVKTESYFFEEDKIICSKNILKCGFFIDTSKLNDALLQLTEYVQNQKLNDFTLKVFMSKADKAVLGQKKDFASISFICKKNKKTKKIITDFKDYILLNEGELEYFENTQIYKSDFTKKFKEKLELFSQSLQNNLPEGTKHKFKSILCDRLKLYKKNLV